MALQKLHMRPDGSEGDYWRIENIEFDTPDLKAKTVRVIVRFYLYKSKADHTAGKTTMGESRTISLVLSLSQVANFIYTNAKTAITSDQLDGETPFFDGSADI